MIEPCILAGSEVGDIVLDPFMGSGTTAAVAKALGRDYIGCELHEDYGNLIKKRVQEYKPVKRSGTRALHKHLRYYIIEE